MNKNIIKLIVAFSIVFSTSLLTETLPLSILGDWKCTGSGEILESGSSMIHYKHCDYTGYHTATIHWGFRHYVLVIMGLVLFFMAIVNMISSAMDESAERQRKQYDKRF